MRNKLISLSLICSLLLSNANAGSLILEKSSTTSASEWKDPASGITYNNFGSVNFKFKKNVTSFAPWVKARPPSLNAGCGGVSLDAGFAAFLDLETIGKQLEQATSSIGMGVITVLLQTMPSIAKAFENIQKLIRKLQSMLANACQSTVSLLNSDPQVKKAKDNASSWLSENSGADYFNETMEGATKKVEKWEKMLTCDVSDVACVKNATLVAFGIADDKKSAEKIAKRETKAIPYKLSNAIVSPYTVADVGAKKDTLVNVLVNDKFDGHTLNMDADERQYIALRIAIFGTLAVPYADGVDSTQGLNVSTGKMSTDATVIKELAQAIEKGSARKPSYKLKYYDKINTTAEIVKFLTGDGLTGTNTNSIKVPSDFNYRIVLGAENSTKTGGSEGSLVSRTYLEAKSTYNQANSYTIEWAGIQNASYLTILHELDSITYAAPATPIGVFMPKGSDYLSMVKKYANKKDYPKYADLLAKINVKYAMSELIRSAKREAKLAIAASQTDSIEVDKYIKVIEDIEKQIQDKFKDYSGDVVYLNNLDQIFDNMKQTTLQKRLNRAKGR